MQKNVLLVLLILLAFSTFTYAQTKDASEDGHANDRAAIIAHIESIFQAFINKDIPALRATHSEDWRGFLEGSPVPIRGIEEYMIAIGAGPNSTSGVRNPNTGMSGYKMTDVDVIFYGPDIAVTCFNADINLRTGGSSKLRILDIHARRNGRWIQTASHTVIHPQASEKQMAAPANLFPQLRQQILASREAVWRAWFTNDQAQLEKLIPEDAIAINSGSVSWEKRNDILEGAKKFAATGAKLTRLEFPRTEIQMYGRTIILYTIYSYELEKDGQKSTQSGRGTEIFVVRGGQLVNTGWHLDANKD